MSAKDVLSLSLARDNRALRMELERMDRIVAEQRRTIAHLRAALKALQPEPPRETSRWARLWGRRW